MRIADLHRTKSPTRTICAGLCVIFACATTANAQFFTRITDAGGIVTDAFLSSGASWTDINGDGWPDLYALGETTNRFYLNNMDGTFASITAEHFVTPQGLGNIGIWADYDNDGHLDLYLGNTTTQPGGSVPAPNFLYRNTGPPLYSLSVVDIGEALTTSPSASWIDYDQDGDVDLFAAGARVGGSPATSDLFYRNDGGNAFVRRKDLTVLQVRSGAGTHDIWVDYDNDGDQDLFVLNWGSQNQLFKSLLTERGNPNLFEEIESNGLLDESGLDISSSWGDYDNDGDYDVFVAFSNNTADRLYQNNGDGTFSPVTNTPVVANATSSTFGVWGDYDNDGDLDLFVARLALNPIESTLYRNDGGGQFVSVDSQEGGDILASIPGPQGGMWGDYDNDGDLDLYVLTYAIPNQSSGTPQPNYLFRNDRGSDNHWLTVSCVGQSSNRSAIGARIRVKASIDGQSVWQTRFISGGAASFVFQAELRAQFGLGDAAMVDSLVIHWPSGITQVVEDVAADQFLTVNEGVPSGFLRANFYAAETTGPDSGAYEFQFVDVSLADPNMPVTSWQWDFDSDGQTDSQEQNPTWVLTSPIRARRPVSLRVSNGMSSSLLLREAYIEVGPLPDTHVDTQRLTFSAPANLGNADTSFYVYNLGRGADSLFASISSYGAADSAALAVSPAAFELAAGDTMRVTYSVVPTLITVASNVSQVNIRSKYNPGAQDFSKTVIFRRTAATSVAQYGEDIPNTFRLLQNHPNPFNGATSIRFDLPRATRVAITIYNIRGQRIATLVDSDLPAGRHAVQWDGRDQSRKGVSTGLYVYRIQTEQHSTTRKLLFLQ